MQITISRNVLAEALAELTPLAGKNKVLPILNNIKFVTKGNRIRLQTSDGETTIRKYVESESIDQDGEFLVDCASLNAFVSKVNSNTLNLILDGTTLTVKHAKGKAEFQTSSAADFVEPKQAEEMTEATIPTDILAKFISIARSFVGDDDLRPQLKPIRAIISDGKFTVCATDTRKMFVDTKAIDGENPDMEWYIEPVAFSSIVKACKGQETAVIKVSERNVSYRVGATTIFTLQTKGNYPQFKRVIPQNHTVDVVCDKSDIVEAMQRAMLFAPDSRLIKVSVSALAMDIQADNITKLQKSVETLSCTSNAELVFGANSRFMLDCINACASDDVTMEINDASRPIVFKDSLNPDRTVLCMPMSLVNP